MSLGIEALLSPTPKRRSIQNSNGSLGGVYLFRPALFDFCLSRYET